MIYVNGRELARDVNIQDQTTPPLIGKFNQIHDSTTLASVTSIGDKTITVADATGFVIGDYIIIFSNVTNRVYVGYALNVVGTTITLDTPLDSAFPIGADVDASSTALNIDGSVTPQVFGIRGAEEAGIQVKIDITRIIMQCQTATAVDLSTFGDIAGGLTNGLVLRKTFIQ